MIAGIAEHRQDALRQVAPLLAFLAVHVLIKLLLAERAMATPLSGDEIAYVDGAKALSNVVRDVLSLRGVDMVEVKVNIVSNGWFLPGVSLLLTPLYVWLPDAGAVAVRIYMGTMSTVLLVVVAWVAHTRLGRWYAIAVVLFPGLVPMWLLFSYSAWGDLVGGLLSVLLLIAALRGLLTMRAGHHVRSAQILAIGVLSAATLYVRSSMLPLVVGILAAFAVGALVVGRSASARWRGLVSATAATVVLVGLLMPWSVLASHTFGTPVVTTTTLPLSMAFAFGDIDDVCRISCGTANPFFGAVRYSREVSLATGDSEVVIQEQMAAHALEGLTPSEYAEGVLRNTGNYLSAPAGFLPRFRPPDVADLGNEELIRGSTRIAFVAALALGLLGLVVVSYQDEDRQLLSVFIKVALLALCVQPFVHTSGSRYWPAYAPVLAISGVYGLSVVRERAGSVGVQRGPGRPMLVAMQVIGVVGSIVGAGALLLLGG